MSVFPLLLPGALIGEEEGDVGRLEGVREIPACLSCGPGSPLHV